MDIAKMRQDVDLPGRNAWASFLMFAVEVEKRLTDLELINSAGESASATAPAGGLADTLRALDTRVQALEYVGLLPVEDLKKALSDILARLDAIEAWAHGGSVEGVLGKAWAPDPSYLADLPNTSAAVETSGGG
jgi:hypothetical protein